MKHALDGGANWRNLANTTEPSMCGDDAGFSSNYFDHLFLLSSLLIAVEQTNITTDDVYIDEDNFLII